MIELVFALNNQVCQRDVFDKIPAPSAGTFENSLVTLSLNKTFCKLPEINKVDLEVPKAEIVLAGEPPFSELKTPTGPQPLFFSARSERHLSTIFVHLLDSRGKTEHL